MKFIYDGQLINYTLIERLKRKSISLRIKNKTVEIIYPQSLKNKIIPDKILRDNIKWILKNIENSPIILKHTYQEGDIFYFHGEPKTLVLVTSTKRNVCIIGDSIIIYAQSLSPNNIKSIIRRFYKEETYRIVLPRVRNAGYSNKVFVKYYKRLWGMCRNANSLGFSSRLACIPIDLIDNVVFHEIAHLYVSNHGKDFYAKLNALYPEYKIKSKNLNQISKKHNFTL